MSGDFPDDWFRPVDPTPPNDESAPEQDGGTGGGAESGTETSGTGPATSTATDPGQSSPGQGSPGQGTSGVNGSGVTGSGGTGSESTGSGVTSSGINRTGGGASTGTTGGGTIGSATSSGVGSGSVPKVEPPATPARGITTDLDSGPPSGPEPGVIPVIAAPGALVVGRVEGQEHEAPSGSPLHPGVVVLVVVILSLAIGLVVGLLVVGARPTEPAPTPSTVPSTTVAAPSARQPYTGVISQVKTTGVKATCTSTQKPDAKGNLVDYKPENMTDEDSTTAWRCNGDGIGKAVTFTFAPGTKLVGVGLLNGYAKSSGTDRYYDQFRRVLAVRWDMPDGTYFIQYLSDNNLSVQRVMIPITTVDGGVTMTIQETSPPGVPDSAERDAVLISTVEFWTVPG